MYVKVWLPINVEVTGTTVVGAAGVLLAVAAPTKTSAVALEDTLVGNSKMIVAASATVFEI